MPVARSKQLCRRSPVRLPDAINADVTRAAHGSHIKRRRLMRGMQRHAASSAEQERQAQDDGDDDGSHGMFLFSNIEILRVDVLLIINTHIIHMILI